MLTEHFHPQCIAAFDSHHCILVSVSTGQFVLCDEPHSLNVFTKQICISCLLSHASSGNLPHVTFYEVSTLTKQPSFGKW